MSIEKRTLGAQRRSSKAGWTGSDSRDGTRSAEAAESTAPPRPVVDARGRAIVTPNGFPLYF
ncbi:MAG TPA: hypothetical protein VHF22_09855 [Planctomycetota bacterium]|nr:hypothetical protein [Planctomycetota bacterium]